MSHFVETESVFGSKSNITKCYFHFYQKKFLINVPVKLACASCVALSKILVVFYIFNGALQVYPVVNFNYLHWPFHCHHYNQHHYYVIISIIMKCNITLRNKDKDLFLTLKLMLFVQQKS